MADELLDVGHVVVEVERALAHRHHARVDPVGDVDLVVAQQRLDRVAQQGAVVARQRRDQQHRRVVLEVGDVVGVVGETLEAQQPAEWFVDHHALDHRVFAAVDLDAVDAERGLLVILADPVHQFVAGRKARGAGHGRQPTAGGGEHLRAGVGPVSHRGHPCAAEFVHLIEQHRVRFPWLTVHATDYVALQRNGSRRLKRESSSRQQVDPSNG